VTTLNPAALGLDLVLGPEDPTTTRTLLEAARRGDGHAYSQLVRPHLGLLYGIAHRACGDAALAEDAVQEALEIAYRRLGSLREDSSLRSFLAGIATRRASTLLRSERRRRVWEGKGEAAEQAPRGDELLEAERLAARIRSALAGLPAKRQAVVLLRLEGGLLDEEIAQAVGSTAGSVRVLVHLGLRQLREALDPEEGGR
jgi:RNA polymerase sigma-70 factor (ECF subfamily)